MKFVGPIMRISLGLVGLTLCLILVAQLLFGVLRDDTEVARRARGVIAEDIAMQAAILIQREDFDTLQRTFEAMVARESDILSIGVRLNSGALLAQTARHPQHWAAKDDDAALTHFSIPIYAANRDWANVEMVFTRVTPKTWREWMYHPFVAITLVVALGGFLLYAWYMRRVLDYIDPTKAIPDRVRKALDTLTEGVIVVDPNGRVVLANDAFRGLHGEEKLGFSMLASDIEWLKSALARPAAQHPWNVAMRNGMTVAELLEIAHVPHGPRKIRLAASPITDEGAAVRGCLVSFTDVTELDRKNNELEKALGELEASRRKIAIQNDELRQLANIDPLTGCMNRRAFFEAAEGLMRMVRDSGAHFCCLMIDIDKFKSINDGHGHTVGDQVLQQVARVLKAALRPTDLLCRYGGEEFCILLPGLDAEHAAAVAERMRSRVEEQAGPGIRWIPNLSVTASVGLSSLEFGAASLAALIDEADQALYAAKQNGRNRLIRYDAIPRPRVLVARS